MSSLRHQQMPSPLGPLTLVADAQERLCGLYLPDHRDVPSAARGNCRHGGIFELAAGQLDEYFAGERTAFELPFATNGSPLQEQVWSALLRVPYASSTTYGRIAAELGLGPGAARAVGAANARNPLSIIIPCHRVLGASGALTGYAGGLAAKRYLLDLESHAAGIALFA